MSNNKRHILKFESFLNECGCEDGANMIKKELASIEENTEKKSEYKKITVIARDPEGSLEKIINAIKEIGNTGHGFEIVMDPGQDGETKFYWDGDGPNQIQEITAEDHEHEEKEENPQEIDESADENNEKEYSRISDSSISKKPEMPKEPVNDGTEANEETLKESKKPRILAKKK